MKLLMQRIVDNMTYLGTMAGILLFFGASFIFILRYGFDWYHGWKSAITTNGRKILSIKTIKSRLLCLLGIAGLIISVVVFSFLMDYAPPEPLQSTEPPTPSEDVPSTTPSGAASPEGNHVVGKRYDNAVYTGYIDSKTNKPHGDGEMLYSTGDKYNGAWTHGVRHGWGKMQYYNEDMYMGGWENDKRHGEGFFAWNDGKEYRGAYNNDLRHGRGVFTGWQDLDNGWTGIYEGESVDDKFHGEGIFTFNNGDKFAGIYNANYRWTGTYTREDGTGFHMRDGKIEGVF